MSGAIQQKTTVRTNTVKDSVCKVDVKPVTFAMLWDNYVTGKPYDDPTGEYENQCAIRMSATLHRIGIDMKSFSQKWVKPAPGKSTLGRILLNGKPTATRAVELATWLDLHPFCGLPSKSEDITGQDWETKVKGRTGIICFDRYWTQAGESVSNASGGHVDLWNGSRLTNNGVLGTVETFMRFGLGINAPWLPIYSDLRNSKNIRFWEMK
jgi:hypothetical protein